MTKIRLFVPLFVILVMGMATSAFAQLSCNVASTPVSRATSTGHAEQAGDLIFNCTGGGAATTLASMTVSYPGVIITNNTSQPAGPPTHFVGITGQTGSFVGAGSPAVSDASISNATGQIVITIPANAGVTGSFSLTGVLVSLADMGLSSLSANISVSPGANVLITAGQNVATVITSIQSGISATQATPALYFSGTGAPVLGKERFQFTVTENYIDLFRDSATQYLSATQDTQLIVTFANLPTGSSFTNCTATALPAGSLPAVVVSGTGATTKLTISFGGAASLTAVETLTIGCGTNSVGGLGGVSALSAVPTTLPTAANNVTATVSLGPTGTALSSATPPAVLTTTNLVPRYKAVEVSLGTVLSFTPNTTTMIIPYVTVDPEAVSGVGAAGKFDTGLVIANTSADVIGAGSIFTSGGATAQPGTITLNFFPSSGTAADRFSVTTASIPAGGSYVTNVSQVVKDASKASFRGYIIAVANFTNAHGSAFVYGGGAADRITSIVDVLVIPSPNVSARTALGGAAQIVEETTR